MRKLLTLLISLCLALIASHAFADLALSTTPKLNNGKKWRVAYVESAPFANYAGTFYYLLKGLEEKGWAKGTQKVPFTWGQTDTKEMWSYLAKHPEVSDFIEFIPDGHYSISRLDPRESTLTREKVDKSEANLCIVMGTVAAKLMSAGTGRANQMVFSTSNAYKSGIVGGIDYSANSSVWAHMDPNRYKVQVEVFHDIFKFGKLGVVYDETPNGRTFAAIDDVEAVAKQRKFELVKIIVQPAKNAADQDRYFNDLLQAHKSLASHVDAVYHTLSPAPGLRPSDLFPVLQPLYEKKIPVFSQYGDADIARGALMSIGRSNFTGLGLFGAEQVARLFNGVHLDKLPQIYSEPPNIALNMEVAKLIGYKPPFSVLLSSEKIFLEVHRPEPEPRAIIEQSIVGKRK